MANFRVPESGVTVTAGVELLRDVRLDERPVISYDLRYTAWLDPHRQNRSAVISDLERRPRPTRSVIPARSASMR
jgi:hypothetical protein